MDPYIQPKDPSLSGADFDVHGKINTTEKPIDVWPDGKSTGKPKAVTYTTQTSTKSANCITSWGETVKNGQFIRAYVSPIGLIDMPCEVELRICTNGVLKGTFTNRTCTFKNMTYRDYLVGNTDSSIPTPGDLLNAVDSEEQKTKDSASSFWEWLSIYF
ncbi:TPA: hypothetical protein DEP21_02285 [Patescibacteria group bacterium]|nr:hypothetical protein [Candidatus Gracilibacteria bacterium]